MSTGPSVRQALLEQGLSVRGAKERLEQLGLDGTTLLSAVTPAMLAELTAANLDPSPVAAASVASPLTDGAGMVARLERTRLLLHRLALQSHALEAVTIDLPRGDSGAGSALRHYLGLHPPPHEIQAEQTRIEERLARPIVGPPGEARLVGALGLGPVELDALWLFVATEISPRHLWLLDALYGARTDGAVSVAFLRHLLGATPAVDAALAPDGALFRYALLAATGDGHFRAGLRALDVLAGAGNAAAPELAGLATTLATPARAPRLPSVSEAALLVELERHGPPPRLLATGPEGCGARAVAFTVARALDRQVIEVDLAALAAADQTATAALVREAHLQRAVLLLRNGRLLDGDRFTIAERARLFALLRREPIPLVTDGGLGESLGILFGVGVAMDLRHLPLDLPTTDERAGLWRDALAAAEPEVTEAARAEQVAAVRAFPIGVDHMADAIALARVAARADDGNAHIPVAALKRACSLLVTHRLGEFAVKVEAKGSWEDLVVPEEVGNALADFVQHAQLARYVLEELGYGKRLSYGRGLTALFSGASGTGKTMAATLIAAHLGVELYRVDLAQIVSKYIGETEQRLAGVFHEANSTGAALLFDEADSLFAKRTEVRSSNDRYANLEVNFLLQKLEDHPGISLLTTNFSHNIDKAFLRRIRFHVEFPEPDVEARALLWRTMVPEEAPRRPDINFHELAARYSLSGGAIRNAVLRAAFRAASEEKPLAQEHLEQAARTELNALGRLQWEPKQ